jgi:hypothetical protein
MQSCQPHQPLSSTKRKRATSPAIHQGDTYDASPKSQGSPARQRRKTRQRSTKSRERRDWVLLGYVGRPPSQLKITTDCKIVGVKHYLGIVYLSERLGLMRQPENEHDANAIRVDNIDGVQVGQYAPIGISLTIQSSPRLGSPSGSIVRYWGFGNRRYRHRSRRQMAYPHLTPVVGGPKSDLCHAPAIGGPGHSQRP